MYVAPAHYQEHGGYTQQTLVQPTPYERHTDDRRATSPGVWLPAVRISRCAPGQK